MAVAIGTVLSSSGSAGGCSWGAGRGVGRRALNEWKGRRIAVVHDQHGHTSPCSGIISSIYLPSPTTSKDSRPGERISPRSVPGLTSTSTAPSLPLKPRLAKSYTCRGWESDVTLQRYYITIMVGLVFAPIVVTDPSCPSPRSDAPADRTMRSRPPENRLCHSQPIREK